MRYLRAGISSRFFRKGQALRAKNRTQSMIFNGGGSSRDVLRKWRATRERMVSRGRVHMWTRLSTHHAPWRAEGGGGGRRWKRGVEGGDGVQRLHNGHVRQGWILLINPTGYIVPPARRTYRSVPARLVPEAERGRSSSRRAPSPFLDLPVPRFHGRHESGILLSG